MRFLLCLLAVAEAAIDLRGPCDEAVGTRPCGGATCEDAKKLPCQALERIGCDCGGCCYEGYYAAGETPPELCGTDTVWDDEKNQCKVVCPEGGGPSKPIEPAVGSPPLPSPSMAPMSASPSPPPAPPPSPTPPPYPRHPAPNSPLPSPPPSPAPPPFFLVSGYYPRLDGCDAEVTAYCLDSCAIGEVTLPRKFGGDPWRCFGLSTLSEDTLEYEGGKKYCTRNKGDQIPGKLADCLDGK